MSALEQSDQDRVELVGTVVPLRTLEAPVSGSSCVLYQVRLTLLQRLLDGLGAGTGGGAKETAGAWFWVRCDQGLVLVDPADARLQLTGATRTRVCLGQDPLLDARITALYGRLQRNLTSQRVTCRELRLVPGQAVWVAGPLSHPPDPRGAPSGYREPPRVPLLAAEQLQSLE